MSDEKLNDLLTSKQPQMTPEQLAAKAVMVQGLINEVNNKNRQTAIELNGPGIVHPLKYNIEEYNHSSQEAIAWFIKRCNIYKVYSGTKSYYISIGLTAIETQNEKIHNTHMNETMLLFGNRYAGEKHFNPRSKFLELLRSQKRVLTTTAIGDRKFLKLAVCSDNWVKPKVTYNRKPHPIFDILLDCLSGEDHRFKDHLERCILQKRFFPEDHLIPCIVWSDPGGTGKNLFVDTLLKTMFDGATISRSAHWIFDTHSNGEITGKVVIMADDVDKMPENDFNNAKRQIHNTELDTRVMRGDPEKVTNVAWFIMASNVKNIIKVRGGGADRRWSILNLGYDRFEARTLPYQIQRHFQFQTRREAEDYEALNIKVLSNVEEIGYWLGELVMRHGIPKTIGSMSKKGYHDDDYWSQSLENRRHDLYVKTFDLAFMTNFFTSVYVSNLFEFHKAVNNIKNVSIDIEQFGREIRNYLKESSLIGHWGHTTKDGEFIPGEPGKRDGYMHYYRYDDNGDKVNDNNPLPKSYNNKEIVDIILSDLYNCLEVEWNKLLPKPYVEYEKDVWSKIEIMDLLRQREDVEGWDDARKASEIDQFLCHIRDIRSVIQSEIDSEAVESDVIPLTYQKQEIIECYHDRYRRRLYRLTTRSDATTKPSFSTQEWGKIPELIDRWIGTENPTSDLVLEKKMLRYVLLLLEQTHLTVDEILNLKWDDCQKMQRDEDDAKKWLKVYSLPDAGKYLATFKVSANKIVFGMENVVNELVRWRGDSRFLNDDDLVFCLNRGSKFDFPRVFGQFTKQFNLIPK